MLKNAFFQVHWFVGITAGIVLGIVGFTGGMLSFEHQIVDWLNRDVRSVEARAEAASASRRSHSNAIRVTPRV
jgi:sulfite reductase (NADPH) flavoprotein alpha-component